jgi:hypothetical protein
MADIRIIKHALHTYMANDFWFRVVLIVLGDCRFCGWPWSCSFEARYRAAIPDFGRPDASLPRARAIAAPLPHYAALSAA